MQPPLRVGIGNQLSMILKAKDDGGLQSGVGYRETCHADGQIQVFVRVPLRQSGMFKEVLNGIGYWGQGHGFASCTEVQETEPWMVPILLPLNQLPQVISFGAILPHL